jgi:hypothetical protein
MLACIVIPNCVTHTGAHACQESLMCASGFSVRQGVCKPLACMYFIAATIDTGGYVLVAMKSTYQTHELDRTELAQTRAQLSSKRRFCKDLSTHNSRKRCILPGCVRFYEKNTCSYTAQHIREPVNRTVVLRTANTRGAEGRNEMRTYLKVLEGEHELLVEPPTSAAPGAPPLCHRCPLVRLQLQLAIHLHL